MRELYTLELSELVRELKPIEGLYVDQFYETEKNRFRFRLSRKGERVNLQCILPYAINRTDMVEIKEEATNFSLGVRKRASGARITGIGQLNNDRIVMIKLEKAGEESSVIFEMFGRGNMIIADSAMKIQLAYMIHDFKDRSIRSGSIYKPPKNTSIDIFNSDAVDELQKETRSQKGDGTVMNYLSKRIGIGKMYLKEALKRSEVNPEEKLGEINYDRQNAIFENVRAIIEECIKRPKVIAYERDGRPVNFALCRISEYSDMEEKAFGSFEECLDFVYQGFEFKKEETNEEEERITSSIEKQKLILEGIQSEAEQNKRFGDYIMKHMHELNRIIESARSSKSPKIEDIQKLSDEIRILNINLKSKSIRIKSEKENQ